MDGFIAGPGDGPAQPLGLGGERLFTWFEHGDTSGRFYPWMKMSAASAAAFDGFIARIGAVITGLRTYDIAGGWDGEGEVVPVLLGGGVRLLDGLEPGTVSLDLVGVVDAPGVTNLTYQVMR